MPGCCCHPVFISTAQERVCWVQNPRDVTQRARMHFGDVPRRLCPKSSHPSATLEEHAHLSGDSDTVVMAGGFVFPKKKLAHHWPGSDLGSPGGTAQVSAPQAAPPPPRSHPGEAGFCLPGDLHSSMLPPSRFPSVGCFC